MAGTLPAGGGSSMPSSNQVKKVVKGQQYRPAGGTGNVNATPATVVNVPPPAMLPKTG